MSPRPDDKPDIALTHRPELSLGPAEAIREAVEVLARHGVASPRVDAELLTAYVLGVPRSRLMSGARLSAAQLARLRDLVTRRARRVPLQHLTGTAAFRYLELAVGPGVFVPRPETEPMVGWALDRLAADPVRANPLVVDLCGGSGAIALSIAHECPQATVYTVESAPQARVWLCRNADTRAAAGDRPIRVVAGDAADPAVLSTLDGTVDLVLCNPPYVPAGTVVAPEVGGHDPYDAVFSGADGLDLIRRLVGRVAGLLRPGGWFGIEHDDGHGGVVPALLSGDGRYGEVADHPDLTGRPRFATARRLADCYP